MCSQDLTQTLSKLKLTSSLTNVDGVEFKADFVRFKADGAQGTRGDDIKDGYNV